MVVAVRGMPYGPDAWRMGRGGERVGWRLKGLFDHVLGFRGHTTMSLEQPSGCGALGASGAQQACTALYRLYSPCRLYSNMWPT